jgi:hypothetical protein
VEHRGFWPTSLDLFHAIRGRAPITRAGPAQARCRACPWFCPRSVGQGCHSKRHLGPAGLAVFDFDQWPRVRVSLRRCGLLGIRSMPRVN